MRTGAHRRKCTQHVKVVFGRKLETREILCEGYPLDIVHPLAGRPVCFGRLNNRHARQLLFNMWPQCQARLHGRCRCRLHQDPRGLHHLDLVNGPRVVLRVGHRREHRLGNRYIDKGQADCAVDAVGVADSTDDATVLAGTDGEWWTLLHAARAAIDAGGSADTSANTAASASPWLCAWWIECIERV